jgi:transcriptional regulator NrdR family protein
MTCPRCQADTLVATCRTIGPIAHRVRKCSEGHRFHTIEQFSLGRYPWPKRIREKKPAKKNPHPISAWLTRIAAKLAE